MKNRAYHSDELLKTDKNVANEECRLEIYNIYEKEKNRHNHIVKVVNKNGVLPRG